jgi:hypothetical protein
VLNLLLESVLRPQEQWAITPSIYIHGRALNHHLPSISKPQERLTSIVFYPLRDYGTSTDLTFSGCDVRMSRLMREAERTNAPPPR